MNTACFIITWEEREKREEIITYCCPFPLGQLINEFILRSENAIGKLNLFFLVNLSSLEAIIV